MRSITAGVHNCVSGKHFILEEMLLVWRNAGVACSWEGRVCGLAKRWDGMQLEGRWGGSHAGLAFTPVYTMFLKVYTLFEVELFTLCLERNRNKIYWLNFNDFIIFSLGFLSVYMMKRIG